MKDLNEYIIGFDARRMNLLPNEKWDDERKRTYSIVENTKRILSTDTLVWPSLVKQKISQAILDIEPEKREKMFPHVDFDDTGPFAPDWIGSNSPFWDNLESLKQHIAILKTPEEFWLIAGTCFIDDKTRLKLEGTQPYGWPPYIESTTPPKLNPSWPLLGYDVSDAFRVSGLTNCGYEDADFAQHPRSYWAKILNENHLFQELEGAIAFSQFSNERVSEHAPFFVYGIYRIE